MLGKLTVRIAGKPSAWLALLAVVYAIRGADDEIVRLISARKADLYEQAQYRKI